MYTYWTSFVMQGTSNFKLLYHFCLQSHEIQHKLLYFANLYIFIRVINTKNTSDENCNHKTLPIFNNNLFIII